MYSKNNRLVYPRGAASKISEPEPLNKGRRFAGRFRIHLTEIDSTNSFLLRNEELLKYGGLVVTADRQTAGRGRKGREWLGINGEQLVFSIVLHPELGNHYLPAITLLTGLGVYKALRDEGCGLLAVKWPNDILLNSRKVCGILCELRMMASQPVVVAGIGLNVKGGRGEFPGFLRNRATTIEAETGLSLDKERLLESILNRLDTVLKQAHKGKITELFREWEQNSDSIGRGVRFHHKGSLLAGEIAGLDEIGRLKVRLASNGVSKTLIAEEVEFI